MRTARWSIRPVDSRDVDRVREIVELADLFSPNLLDALLEPFFAGEQESDSWLVAVDVGHGGTQIAAGVAWVRPEPLTERTWNLVALGVHPSARRSGVATALIDTVEQHVAGRGGTPLLVETSSLPAFESARVLYEGLGYRRAAVIEDYWDSGDDKVIYTRRLPR